MNEFLEQFLIESRELIAQASEALLALEHESSDAAHFDGAFRAMHTLKGAAGIMDFDAMAQLCHAAEDSLSTVRAGSRQMTPALVTDCLSCLDQVTNWLAAMEASEALPEAAQAEAAALIARLASGHGQGGRLPAQASPVQTAFQPGISGDAADILHEQVALLALQHPGGAAGRVSAAIAVIENVLLHAKLGGARTADVPGGVTSRNALDAAAARPARADVARIDALIRLAGELVVVKNALGHRLEQAPATQSSQSPANLTQIHSQLDRLTADLLRACVAARVVPLRQVFRRFPRLVRDLAAGLDKKVSLVTEGDATEADRPIVEALFEPLLHVLRNAVDHGIETPDQREKSGKPIPAIITLRAARIGEEVVVEIADDGCGIDPAAIRATAQARGLAGAAALAAMSDTALLELIFAPGFSTSGTVSDLSGRGVGMDAVRAAISGLGGRVELATRPGAGTLIRFHLPFTVLLTRLLVVQAGGQAFGLPFEALAETLQVPRRQVIRTGDTDAVHWRGRTLPLLSLAQLVFPSDAGPDDGPAEVVQAVIIRDEVTFTALQVGRIGRQIDVMLKPLDGPLTGMRGIAGTALQGDGNVLIVLELQELLK